jgi:hypothetical protein
MSQQQPWGFSPFNPTNDDLSTASRPTGQNGSGDLPETPQLQVSFSQNSNLYLSSIPQADSQGTPSPYQGIAPLSGSTAQFAPFPAIREDNQLSQVCFIFFSQFQSNFISSPVFSLQTLSPHNNPILFPISHNVG